MKISRIIGERLSRIGYVRSAIREQADLSAFKKKPDMRIISGLFFMGLSYVIGWPAITGLGIVSIYLREPLIVILGGAIIYGISHLVFMLGMYLAGAKYSIIFMKWATRMAVEKLIGREAVMAIVAENNDVRE